MYNRVTAGGWLGMNDVREKFSFRLSQEQWEPIYMAQLMA